MSCVFRYAKPAAINFHVSPAVQHNCRRMTTCACQATFFCRLWSVSTMSWSQSKLLKLKHLAVLTWMFLPKRKERKMTQKKMKRSVSENFTQLSRKRSSWFVMRNKQTNALLDLSEVSRTS